MKIHIQTYCFKYFIFGADLNRLESHLTPAAKDLFRRNANVRSMPFVTNDYHEHHEAIRK